ncbi:MAG: restriction endonuclease subunit S [Pseudonocardiaceae bacterium]
MNTQRVSIGDLAEQVRGVTYKKEDASRTPKSGYLPVLRAGNITDDGLTFADLVFIPAVRITDEQMIRRNDVVIATSSGSLEVVGKAATALENFEGGFGAFCKVLRPGDRLHPAYFSHFFKTHEYRRRVSALASGVSINNLRNEHLNKIELPLPPLLEQRRIAEILDQAEVLRAKRREVLAQLNEMIKSIFFDMFSGSRADGWTLTTVAGVARADQGAIRTGPFGSQLLHSEFVDNGIAVLGIDNVVTNEFRWADRRFVTETKYRELNRYTVRPGDVLITIMGTCGRCAVAPDDIPLTINTKHLCCITLDRAKCLPVFLHAYFLRHPVARRYLNQTAKGAIMSGLNMGIIKAMPLLLPPLALQQEFADLVEAVERLKISHRAHLAELDALFASLQYRAFRGEL